MDEEASRAHGVDRTGAGHPREHPVQTEADRTDADQPVRKPADTFGDAPSPVGLFPRDVHAGGNVERPDQFVAAIGTLVG
jgi:hypothetical protein